MCTYPHPLVWGHVRGPRVTPACQVDRHALSLNELPQLPWPPHSSCNRMQRSIREGTAGGNSPANEELSRNQLEVGMKSMGCCHSPTCRHSSTDVCVRSVSQQVFLLHATSLKVSAQWPSQSLLPWQFEKHVLLKGFRFGNISRFCLVKPAECCFCLTLKRYCVAHTEHPYYEAIVQQIERIFCLRFVDLHPYCYSYLSVHV